MSAASLQQVPIVVYPVERKSGGRYRTLEARTKGDFSFSDKETATSVLRGCLIERLDEAFCDGELGKLLWQTSHNEDLKYQGLRVFQAIQAALFPEAFSSEEPEEPGLIPNRGIKGIGLDRYEKFVQMLKIERNN